jgi:hypothetical protein
MATVSIDLEAMRALVAALQAACRNGPAVGSRLFENLKQVWLEVPQLGDWRYEQQVWHEAGLLLADCRRRLGLAELIAGSTYDIQETSVSFDDSLAEGLPADFMFQNPDPVLVDKLKDKLLAAGSDRGMDEATALRHANMIAMMVANAAEPYKSLFLKYVDQVDFKDLPTGKSAHYDSLLNNLNIDIDAMNSNIPSMYYSFFHEFGHAIDDLSTVFGYTTSGFEYNGQDLPNLIHSDVKDNLTKIVSEFTDDAARRDRIIDAILNGSVDQLEGWQKDESGRINPNGWPWQFVPTIPDSDAYTFAMVQDSYTRPSELGNDIARTASDIYGSQTNNTIAGRFTHSDKDRYWDHPILNGHQEKEFWAGYFADNMTHRMELANQAAPDTVPSGYTPSQDPTEQGPQFSTGLDYTQAMFPGASKAAQQMAEEMKQR